jgi:hypothetical protein
MTTAYLIEYAIDGETSVDLTDADHAARFLSSSIEHAHYSNVGFDMIRMFRYDDGALIPLHLARPESGYADADDYLHYPYEVWPVDGPTAATPEFTFTVTIDGRA